MPEEAVTNVTPAKGNKEKYVKIIIGIFLVLSLPTLIIIKSQKPEFPIGWVFVIGAFIIVIGVAGFFGKQIYHFFSSKEKKVVGDTPDTISQEEVIKIAKDLVTSDLFENHIKEIVSISPHSPGKNLIYELKVKLLYPEFDENGKERVYMHIFINANYPSIMPGVIYDITSGRAKVIANSLSKNPEEEPDVEITRTSNPLIGTESETIKKSRKKTEKEESET